MTRHPGRNVPCPCGSGRKYKNCCARRPSTPGLLYSPGEREEALGLVYRHAVRAEYAADREIASRLFWGGRLDELDDKEARAFMEDPLCLSAYFSWLVYDLDVEGPGDTIALRFLAAKGAGLTPGQREFLQRMGASQVRLYEVTAVRLDQGLDLRDLWTDTTIAVAERLATHELRQWDVLGARVITGPAGAPVVEGTPYRYTPDQSPWILDRLRGFKRAAPKGIDEQTFFKRAAIVLHQEWLDLVALRPMPQVVTAEGDSFMMVRAFFDVRNPAQIALALAGRPEFVVQEDGNHVWVEVEDSGRVLGTVVASGERLVLETMSEERADRGREVLESVLGDAVNFRAMRLESPDLESMRDEAMRPGTRTRQREGEGIPPEMEADMVKQVYRQHYESWLDESIPALGNRTPRKAARLKTVRPKLVALLKGLESQMARDRREGRPAIDVGWMWEELGVDREQGMEGADV
ncbi:MAG: YecA family protein [Gemmatimonadales bacterium]